MGELLLRAGLTDDLYRTLSRLMGRLPGGPLHTNILASGVFAAVSGSSLATATTIGSVALPQMKERGYNERLALDSFAAGGPLGILIPPSLIKIVDGLPIVVAVVPIFLPLLHAQGVDLVRLGIIVVILIELGLIMPPVGMNLFVLQGVRKRLYGPAAGGLTDIVVGVLPFVAAMLLVLGLAIAFPEIVPWPVRGMQ